MKKFAGSLGLVVALLLVAGPAAAEDGAAAGGGVHVEQDPAARKTAPAKKKS